MDSLLRFLKNYFFIYEKPRNFTEKEVFDTYALGQKADDALNNPAITKAFNEIENDLFHAWKLCSPKDEEARERLYYCMEGMKSFKSKLTWFVSKMINESNKLKLKRQADKKAA